MELYPAEEKLWACAERGETADFRTAQERGDGHLWRPSVADARRWGRDRTIRAKVVHELWRRGHPVRVDGCIIDGEISTAETAEVSFSAARTIFTETARFVRATFTETARFNGATFTGGALFSDATFTETARFVRATFTETTWFDGVTFTEDAWFDEATFTGNAGFIEAKFGRTARFLGATFTEDAWFDRAMFTETPSFYWATFTEDASFSGATFTSSVGLAHVWVRELDFTRVRVTDGPRVDTTGLRAETINLSGAAFDAPVHLDLSARTIVACVTSVARYSQLRMRCESANFTDAGLGEHTLLAGHRIPQRSATSTPADARSHPDSDVQAKIEELHDRLEAIPSTAALVSLERAVVAGVTVSGLDLTRCQFHGAHGLDKLRIDPGCTFASSRDELVTPAAWLRPRLHTRRRIIADETLVPGLKRLAPAPSERDPDAPPVETRTPSEVAETYRALRKSMEDAKNEPGAADFYYGEMQMRRRAHDRGLTEHVLVTAYWIVSGYGLRAGRALAALVVLMAIAAGIFMNPSWATVTKSYYPADQATSVELRPVLTPGRDVAIAGTMTITQPDRRSLTFTEAAQFSLRESVALIRPASDNRFRPRGVGVVADITLRILGPLLIALALLAIRARTKR